MTYTVYISDSNTNAFESDSIFGYLVSQEVWDWLGDFLSDGCSNEFIRVKTIFRDHYMK